MSISNKIIKMKCYECRRVFEKELGPKPVYRPYDTEKLPNEIIAVCPRCNHENKVHLISFDL
jgi:hypothetical protein